jgi:hypothetical protein
MPQQESRAGQLNADITPKVLFLARISARYKDKTLSQFLEDALRQALTKESMLNDEPNVGASRPFEDAPLFFEGLWHEDDITRLFLVAVTDLKLLAPKQRELFHYVCHELIKQGKRVTLANFQGYFVTSEGGE